MEINGFWLAALSNSNVTVSLLLASKDGFQLTSIGQPQAWSDNIENSLTQAVDASLSSASETAITEDQEPSSIAFIVPPHWVGNDGKIFPQKLKLIEGFCNDLKLKPLGFIANDEAIVEEANLKDGFPASFILLNIDAVDFTLSLVYLGKIKDRIRKSMAGSFQPILVEEALLELSSDATLPPQIIVYGQADDSILSLLKNYSWIGKKSIETFLHFPDIRLYSTKEISAIYAKVIVDQIKPGLTLPETSPLIEPEPEIESDNADLTKDSDMFEAMNPQSEITDASPVEEVAPSDLGFGVVSEPIVDQNIVIDEPVTFVEEPPPIIIDQPTLAQPLPVPRKKIVLPKIHLNFKLSWLLPLALSPLLILIPFIFSTAHITLFLTPYLFSQTKSVVFDSSKEAMDISKGIIPVQKKSFTISASSQIKTSGQKTVGDKAKGEVTIFNQQSNTQTLPKGAILIDPSGKNFELANQVIVAASSYDLNLGVINLGKTRAVILAGEIGPEYNIAKDTRFTFKDSSNASLIAKSEEAFSGGSKNTVAAVSATDKKDVEQKIDEEINNKVEAKIKTDLSDLSGAIKETIQSKKEKIDFSRELGEETDELSATVEATVSVFLLTSDIKSQLVSAYLSSDSELAKSDYDPKSFQLKFKIDKIDADQASGSLTVEGKSIPKIDVIALKKQLSGKSHKSAEAFIKKSIPRLYNFTETNNFKFINFINPLPFRPGNITIEVKSDNL